MARMAGNGFVGQQISHTLQCKKVKLGTQRTEREREKPPHSCVHLSPVSEEADSALAGVNDFLLLRSIVGGDREIRLSIILLIM